VPQVVFQHTLLDGHLRTGFQMLHLAATTRASMQTKVGTAWLNPLRRLTVNRSDNARLPVVLFAMDVDRHHLKRQSALYKNNFAVRPSGDALALPCQVHRCEASQLANQNGLR
jgi:hypothetical protein